MTEGEFTDDAGGRGDGVREGDGDAEEEKGEEREGKGHFGVCAAILGGL